jgi:Tol biopolymer transport system component
MSKSSLIHHSPHSCWIGIRRIRIVLLCFIVASATFLVACIQKPKELEIWYIWRDASSAEIRTLDPSTGQRQVIVRSASGSDILDADISPDGKHVAYLGNDPAQKTSIWLANVDGSNLTQVTPGAETAWYSWLDNNSLILWYGDWIQDPTIPRLDFYTYDTSKQKMTPVVVEGDQQDLFRCALNKFSSHPGLVALSNGSQPGLGHLEPKDGVIKIVTDFTIDLSIFPELIKADCLSWTPDGKKVALQGTTVMLKHEDLFLVSNQGKSVIRLTDFGRDFQEATFSTYAISPDAQWVVATGSLLPRPVFGVSGAATLALVKTDTKQVEFMGLPDISSPDRLLWSPDSQYVAITAPKVFDRMSDNQIYTIDVEKKEIKQLTYDGGQKEVFDWR